MRLDLVIDNARIWTGDPHRPYASRIGVWQGLIIGLDEQLEGMQADTVLDAEGAFLAPGFNDVHAHSVWFGQNLLELNLGAAATAEEALQLIGDYAASQEKDAWVIASNFNPLRLTGALPGRDALDDATAGRPLWIKHASGHAYTLNGVGLRAVDIADYPTEQPDGGKVVTDSAGRATGLVEENAMALVQRHLLPDSVTDIAKALAAATKQYVREGLTSVTDAGIAGGWIGRSPREFEAYQRAHEEGGLLTRMQPMVTLDALHGIPGHADDPAVLGIDTGARTGVGDDWLQLGPVKVFTDGSLLGGTAAMTEEYAHCHGTHGYLLGDPDELRANVLRAAAGGWSLALHAIGDRAVDFAIDTIAEAQRRCGSPRIPARIEHGGVIRDDQIPRLAQHNITLVPQPFFIPTFGDGMARNLGPERVGLSYPAARLLAGGVTLPGSSDRPVAPGAPLGVVQSFLERLTESGAEYAPAERITAEQALSAYTRGSALATGQLHRKGTLERGKLADLVLLSDDILTAPTRSISDIKVLATIVGGKAQYSAVAGLEGIVAD